jgi:hypothetical protein
MNVRISFEIVRSFPTVLAGVIVSFECLSPNLPPFLAVVQCTTLPLVVILPDDILREPRTVTVQITEEAPLSQFDLKWIYLYLGITMYAFR